MRTLKKNKQEMYYSVLLGEYPIYDYYIDSDGNRIPVSTGESEMRYSVPKDFKGNIAMSGGESEAVEFGVNKSDYSAVLVVDKEELPIDETSLIWFESEPVDGSGETIKVSDADYTVTKIIPSLNGVRYLLKKVVK